jgi:hypothetical protein
MTRRQFDEELQRLQRLFTGRQPADSADYLFVPEPSVPYIRGSAARSLAPRFVPLQSGLLVPVGARRGPAPIDMVGTYLTAEDIGLPIGLSHALRWMGGWQREAVLRAVAFLLAQRHAIGAQPTELDRELAGWLFTEPTRELVLNLLRGRRSLLSPQALLIVAKAALQISPENGDEELEFFVPAVLAIQQGLTAPGEDRGEHLSPGGRLFREIVRSQAFYSDTYERVHTTTFQTRWRDLPPMMSEPRMDLVAEFEAATGVMLDDFTALGIGLWARTIETTGQPIPLAFLSSFRWDAERLERALGLISRRPTELGELLERDEERLQGFSWTFDRLRQFPVIRLDDERVLVLSPRLLLERVMGWLPIFDVRQAWRDRGDDTRSARLMTFFERVCERQALDAVRSIGRGGPGRRVYEEDELRAAFGADRRVADAVFDAGSAWIVVEVSTHQLNQRARAGDSEADLARDLELGIYQKAEQLDSTIAALVEDEERLTRYQAIAGRRFVPVLVATEGFPVNPMTTAVIERELAERGLLQGNLVDRIRILDLEELELVEGIAESGQTAFLELLRDWDGSTLRSMDFKTWIWSTPLETRTPSRLDGAFRRAWEPAARALGVDPSELEDPEAPRQ